MSRIVTVLAFVVTTAAMGCAEEPAAPDAERPATERAYAEDPGYDIGVADAVDVASGSPFRMLEPPNDRVAYPGRDFAEDPGYGRAEAPTPSDPSPEAPDYAPDPGYGMGDVDPANPFDGNFVGELDCEGQRMALQLELMQERGRVRSTAHTTDDMIELEGDVAGAVAEMFETDGPFVAVTMELIDPDSADVEITTDLIECAGTLFRD